MKQIRVERPKRRRDRVGTEFLPRDPDIVRAKALSRAARRAAVKSSSLGVEARTGRAVLERRS